jgi:hypothetical protein
MTPALQINRGDGRLLVEALSGRWSFDHERRDKRNAWYYVANAFSLCIDRIDPGAPKLDGKDQGKTFTKFDARFDDDITGEQYHRFASRGCWGGGR